MMRKSILLLVILLSSVVYANSVRDHFIVTNQGDTLRIIELVADEPIISELDSTYCQIDENVYMTYISTYDSLDPYPGPILVLIILGDFVWPSRINDLNIENLRREQ